MGPEAWGCIPCHYFAIYTGYVSGEQRCTLLTGRVPWITMANKMVFYYFQSNQVFPLIFIGSIEMNTFFPGKKNPALYIGYALYMNIGKFN